MNDIGFEVLAGKEVTRALNRMTGDAIDNAVETVKRQVVWLGTFPRDALMPEGMSHGDEVPTMRALRALFDKAAELASAIDDYQAQLVAFRAAKEEARKSCEAGQQ